MDARRNRYLGMLLATMAAIIWAGNFVIARGVNQQIPPITLAFCRWSLATVLMMPIAFNAFKNESCPIPLLFVSNSMAKTNSLVVL